MGFNVQWYLKVTSEDRRLKQYRKNPKNKLSTRVRWLLGLIMNWKSHKLLYSHFFGLHVNAFKFSKPMIVRTLFFR